MKKIHFLHIPKTAGQSVHKLLTDSFVSVSPLRLNSQFNDIGVSAVQNYEVISGHIDWDLMDSGGPAKFTFTVLRDPIDRILSFYYYLRSEANKLDKKTLESPERVGMFNVLNLSPDDYFCPRDNDFKKFIDDHYDNFYSYYFYSKKYCGNRLFSGNVAEDEILEGAFKNLKSLDQVYTMESLYKLPIDLRKIFPDNIFSDLLHMNKGDSLSVEDRLAGLSAVGNCDKAIIRIKEMCKLDYYIFNSINSHHI